MLRRVPSSGGVSVESHVMFAPQQNELSAVVTSQAVIASCDIYGLKKREIDGRIFSPWSPGTYFHLNRIFRKASLTL